MASGYGSGSSSISRQLNNAQNDLKKSFEKLSSGKRINKASDDAAGLAIAAQLQSDAVVLKQANRNIGDAQSAIDITDGALSQVGDITGRLQELATQSANGTLSDEQRTSLNNEFQQLTQEIQRIGATTEFNGKNLLGGEGITVQAGTDSSGNSQIATAAANVQQLSSTLSSLDVSTVQAATAALDAVKGFADSISSSRGELGSTSSRLQVADNNNEERRINSLQAESRIRDADIAQESANNIAASIKSQASVAISAQANLSTQKVLELLK